MLLLYLLCFFFFKQKTAYEMRISDWSSDVCSSDLGQAAVRLHEHEARAGLLIRVQLPAHLVDVAAQDRREIGVDHGGVAAAHQLHQRADLVAGRDLGSEERRGGKGCVSTCRSRLLTYH